MNIVISGLTAAGKTTHALLIARRLGYDYVSASSIMLAKLNIDSANINLLWASQLAKIEEMRDKAPVDEQVNDYLIRQLHDTDHTVFDSWAAPWLSDGSNCLRVLIDSDESSRTRKVRVSQEPYGPFLSLPACHKVLMEKDSVTADRFASLLGVDIRNDKSPFDLVLNNSKFITRPTIDVARRGIARFHTRLLDAIIDKGGLRVPVPAA